MNRILEGLKNQCNRESTMRNYYSIWKKFNNFLIRLDTMPINWEDRTSMYCAHLIEAGIQSSTLKSYVSAIKFVLVQDGYKWKDENILLSTLTHSCKQINDRIYTRLPIRLKLLELLIFEVKRRLHNQHYLSTLYLTMLLVGYYGLFRVGELTASNHSIKAKDVHVGNNKDKILIVLYSSKTHSKESRSQEVRITATKGQRHTFNCPFDYNRKYIKLRGIYKSQNDNFFHFKG